LPEPELPLEAMENELKKHLVAAIARSTEASANAGSSTEAAAEQQVQATLALWGKSVTDVSTMLQINGLVLARCQMRAQLVAGRCAPPESSLLACYTCASQLHHICCTCFSFFFLLKSCACARALLHVCTRVTNNPFATQTPLFAAPHAALREITLELRLTLVYLQTQCEPQHHNTTTRQPKTLNYQKQPNIKTTKQCDNNNNNNNNNNNHNNKRFSEALETDDVHSRLSLLRELVPPSKERDTMIAAELERELAATGWLAAELLEENPPQRTPSSHEAATQLLQFSAAYFPGQCRIDLLFVRLCGGLLGYRPHLRWMRRTPTHE
jgi:hypothetical protein